MLAKSPRTAGSDYEARLFAPETSRTTKATTAGRTRRSASSQAATAPVTRPHKHRTHSECVSRRTL